MSNQEKKERKRKSIELMESIKVQEWKKNQVFNEISSFEWVGIQYFIKPLDFKSNNSKSDLSIDFLFLINKNQFTKGSSNFSIIDSQDITFVEIDGKIINLEKIFDENFEKGLLSRYTMELDLIDFIKIFKYSNPIKV